MGGPTVRNSSVNGRPLEALQANCAGPRIESFLMHQFEGMKPIEPAGCIETTKGREIASPVALLIKEVRRSPH